MNFLNYTKLQNIINGMARDYNTLTESELMTEDGITVATVENPTIGPIQYQYTSHSEERKDRVDSISEVTDKDLQSTMNKIVNKRVSDILADNTLNNRMFKFYDETTKIGIVARVKIWDIWEKTPPMFRRDGRFDDPTGNMFRIITVLRMNFMGFDNNTWRSYRLGTNGQLKVIDNRWKVTPEEYKTLSTAEKAVVDKLKGTSGQVQKQQAASNVKKLMAGMKIR